MQVELRPFVEVDTCLPVNVLIQPNTTAGGPLQGYWLRLEAEPQVLQARFGCKAGAASVL